MAIGNAVSVVGNAGQDPELRFATSGVAIVTVRLAVHQGRDRDGKEKDPAWVTVTAFGDMAENVASSVAKGDRVSVQGRVQTRSWETDSGEKRTATEIVADDVAVSLRFATATVERVERRSPQNGDHSDDPF